MDQETKIIVKEVADEAAKGAVDEALTRLGVDHSDPIEVQKDMAFLREVRQLIEDPETQKDLMHLRKWRKTMDSVQNKGVMTIVGILCTGLVAALILGLKEMLGR